MILTAQGSQCGCYLGKARADVGCHGLSSSAVVFVPGVGLGGREAEVALDPGQGRVTSLRTRRVQRICVAILPGRTGG
jgi:hypothetical protein